MHNTILYLFTHPIYNRVGEVLRYATEVFMDRIKRWYLSLSTRTRDDLRLLGLALLGAGAGALIVRIFYVAVMGGGH